MKKIVLAALLASSVGLATAASAQVAGDWVLAPWQGGEGLYPGVVQSRHGNSVNVRFDDGSVASVPAARLRTYDWRVGTNVVCKWTDGNWYAARITAMGSDEVSIDVVYEDGVRQRTNTGRCRSN
jgi:hypothetical protein